MIYLLDANVLIDANRDYYPLERVPHFWEWLLERALAGSIRIPYEVYDEVADGRTDNLALWARQEGARAALLFDEEPDRTLLNRVLNEGYAPDLTEDELEELGCDPFLAAYALVAPAERCVVTTERSKPKKQRANRHLPDVCDRFGIKNCNTFEFVRELDFRIK